MIHGLISAVICVVFALLRLPSWLCLCPAAFYIGREFTQAEYRYIEGFCGGKRANMPWYGGFLPDAWTPKGIMDFGFPVIICTAAWSLLYFIR